MYNFTVLMDKTLTCVSPTVINVQLGDCTSTDKNISFGAWPLSVDNECHKICIVDFKDSVSCECVNLSKTEIQN